VEVSSPVLLEVEDKGNKLYCDVEMSVVICVELANDPEQCILKETLAYELQRWHRCDASFQIGSEAKVSK
jgi:hypothetical protein